MTTSSLPRVGAHGAILRGAAALAVAASAIACSANNGSSNVGATSEAETVATASANASASSTAPRGPRGPESLLAEALHRLTLTPEQRATIEDALIAEAKNAPRAPDETRLATLAAGVRAGSISVSDDGAPARDARFLARQKSLAAGLTVLHDTLTTAQRKELVLALQTADASRAVRPELDPFAPESASTSDLALRAPPKVRALLSGIDLSEEQLDALSRAFDAQRPSDADRATMRARFEAMKASHAAKLASFAAESFDAASFVAPPEPPEGLRARASDPLTRDLALVTTILTPAQRETLASRIESGATLFGPAPRSTTPR